MESRNQQVAVEDPQAAFLKSIIDAMNERNRSSNKLIEDPDEAKRVIAENFGKPIVLAELPTYKTFKLSEADFNPEYDRRWTGQVIESWAGGERYEKPPSGWIGKALNVGSSDQEWLGAD